MLRLRVVTAPKPQIADAQTLANCWRQANERTLTFLVSAAAYLPDDTPPAVMEQWRVCLEDAAFTRRWLLNSAA